MNNYIENRNQRITKIAKEINNNVIDLCNLEEGLIDELISYYNKQIIKKKKKINDIRKNIKGGK